MKLKLYDRCGVSEYWLVDPEAANVRIYRREKGRLAPVTVLTRRSGATIESPLLPACSLSLDRIFASVR